MGVSSRPGFIESVNDWDVYFYHRDGYLALADIAVHNCGKCARAIVVDRMIRWGETSEQFVEKLAAMEPHVHD